MFITYNRLLIYKPRIWKDTVMDRIIFHCDLDCFFAAVEMRDNPIYKGKPVIIGADPKEGKGRGVVSTCSYEARVFGLHSAMPISRAFKLCPHGIYLRPNGKKYYEVSKEVMQIINSYSPFFQQVSVDEAYIDVTRFCQNYETANILAKKLQADILDQLGITVSIGCAPTKSIAKIASDYNKPNGITLVRPDEINSFLNDMDITRIPGIGKKSKVFYNKYGIYTIGDIIITPFHKMIELFGKNGEWVWNIAHGIDNREVKEFDEERKSISKERTFFEDTHDLKVIISKLEEITEKLHLHVVKHNIFYKTVTLKIRLEGFLTYTRSKSFSNPIQNKNKVIKVVIELLNEFITRKKKIRLVGIKLSNFEKKSNTTQKTIFNYVYAS